ncbi:methyltransferase family protein [Glaciibacter psychrotolerans]|uniref:Protein-S-isoprenylcysteine O-methyltransferase Ste14 n=1 Tax=Glaciibacter psychrotolerans TaxID=670054 RepID=A0A7Z0ED21_9MICO|nr:isoprenylcysteine carboxylmethyltransferase family protein [Leifsonia psychrotolerans]NYJ18692.1 protein-S-isoprenylcysteine O-methyltransferase Ste14 [Leifsonia psychrotolerans]
MKRALAFGLVIVQILLLAALVLMQHSDLWPVTSYVIATSVVLLVAGVLLMCAGAGRLGPAFTATPIPRQNAAIVTTGIYAYVRSPIYLGYLMVGLGLTLVSASFLHIMVWLALLWLLAGKARWEERMLISAHPEYLAYGAHVGRFVPGIGRLRLARE